MVPLDSFTILFSLPKKNRLFQSIDRLDEILIQLNQPSLQYVFLGSHNYHSSMFGPLKVGCHNMKSSRWNLGFDDKNAMGKNLKNFISLYEDNISLFQSCRKLHFEL